MIYSYHYNLKLLGVLYSVNRCLLSCYFLMKITIHIPYIYIYIHIIIINICIYILYDSNNLIKFIYFKIMANHFPFYSLLSSFMRKSKCFYAMQQHNISGENNQNSFRHLL